MWKRKNRAVPAIWSLSVFESVWLSDDYKAADHQMLFFKAVTISSLSNRLNISCFLKQLIISYFWNQLVHCEYSLISLYATYNHLLFSNHMFFKSTTHQLLFFKADHQLSFKTSDYYQTYDHWLFQSSWSSDLSKRTAIQLIISWFHTADC